MLILHQVVNVPSTLGYLKELLNLGQEKKKKEDKFLINLLFYYMDKMR
jgi:hypothetical protein